MQGYCMKCKSKGVEMNSVYVNRYPTKKSARYIAHGICTKCGGKMSVAVKENVYEQYKKE